VGDMQKYFKGLLLRKDFDFYLFQDVKELDFFRDPSSETGSCYELIHVNPSYITLIYQNEEGRT
jgi:hypothetical protein